MEVISHLECTNSPGIIVTIDFEKCFDRIEYSAIRGTFQYFGFNNQFIDMLFLLYSELEMCTTSNGYTSQYFKKTRGVNQGCPRSPLVYSYCGELMAHLIQNNEKIEGISINQIKNILSQFADDTNVFLKYDRIVLNELIDVLMHVEAAMGLKVSYDKTVIYRVGLVTRV